MTQYEMTEKLSDRMGVSMEEAKAALEASEWDMLDAALLLEQEHGVKRAAYTTEQAPRAEEQSEKTGGWREVLRKIGRFIVQLISCGNRNRFEVRRKDRMVLELPVTALVVLLIFMFWVCLPLLVIGLFTGFRYSFSGPELGRENVNRAMDKAAETAEKVKAEVVSDHAAPEEPGDAGEE